MPRRKNSTSTESLIPASSAEESIAGTSAETSDGDSGKVRLKKELGLVDGVGILVGIMVGSGIFVSPSGVAQYSGSVGLSLVIWAVTGIMSTIGALCYAELGTMIPKSGGEYAYITESIGNLVGFLYLWVSLIIVGPTANTIISLTFAYYILQPLFGPCAPDIATKLLAALVITFLTYVNCVSVKVASKISDIFTVTKILALVVIIITGFYALGTGVTNNYDHPFVGSNWSFTAIATAYYQGFVSFAGWNCLNFIVEELKDPFRNLPRAILISMPLVTGVYFFANVAYFAVLTPAEVISSKAVAVTFGNRMLGVMAWTMPFFVACSTFGSINGATFASSRLIFVGARHGQLPIELGLINIHNSTPVPALFILALLSLVMLLVSDVQILINYISFAMNVFIIISVGVLLWERYKHPNRHRPIKIWIGLPIVFIILNSLIMVFTFIERPVEIGIAIGIILSGIPVYYLFVVRKSKSEGLQRIKASILSTVQLVTTSCPQD